MWMRWKPSARKIDRATIEDPGESGETSDLKLKPKTVKVNGRLTEGLQGGDATAEAISIPMSTSRQNKTYSVTGTLSSSSST